MNLQPYKKMADLFDQNAYDANFGLQQPKLSSSRLNGTAYIKRLNERKGMFNGDPYQLTEERLETRYRILKAFVQPDRAFYTFIPALCLRNFFDEIMKGENPQAVYKGVSYNPNLNKNGEKLDNLDFFSWAKRAQEALPTFRLTILDASPYQVLNELGEIKWPQGIREDEFSDWFYGLIEKGVKENPDLMENCQLRSRYLKAMMEATETEGSVISVWELIKNRDPLLLESLEEARRLCEVNLKEGELVQVDRFVTYRRYETEFSKSYTPAVVAEALYFLKKNGVKAKLGPTSETAFDNLIAKCMGQEKIPYSFFWYNRPFERGSNTSNRVYFNDTREDIKKKLERNPSYSLWIDDILTPFSEEKTVNAKVIDLVSRIRKKMENF